MTEGARPPVGTRCAPCNRAAHTCWAAAYSDGDLYPAGVPLCAYCADGESCGNGASKATPPQAAAAAQPVVNPQPQTGLDDGPLLPARRHFGKGSRGKRGPYHKPQHEEVKRLLREGKSAAAVAGITGVSRETVRKLRLEIPELAGKTPVGVRAESARKVQNVAMRTTAVERVAGKVQDSAGKLAEEGYKVISLAEMPGRKHAGVYDDIVAEFMKLPRLSVLTKTFNNREIANTYMLAIVRIGRTRGLKMRQKQDGNTIYVWQE